ncbi:hypothetical protein TrLO_g14543 [Triparma laevis f. longispina]|uniref:Uncharacterized protein n=1 Tax=Triparma laevis f. longispina TaxID=1714387 RepID=A0A9W7FU61_9STRA|nr:hypothetical protein TrLO_g14543 [Triparma laevis f. longispina]
MPTAPTSPVDLATFCSPSQSLDSFMSNDSAAVAAVSLNDITNDNNSNSGCPRPSPTVRTTPISLPPVRPRMRALVPPQSSVNAFNDAYLNYSYFNNSPPVPPFGTTSPNATSVPFLKTLPPNPNPSSKSSHCIQISGPSGSGKTSALLSLACDHVLQSYHTYHESLLQTPPSDQPTKDPSTYGSHSILLDLSLQIPSSTLSSLLTEKIVQLLLPTNPNITSTSTQTLSMLTWSLSRIHIIRPNSTLGCIMALEGLRQRFIELERGGGGRGFVGIEDLNGFHYRDKYVDGLEEVRNCFICTTYLTFILTRTFILQGGVVSGVNDLFLMLTRIRKSCDVVVVGTKPQLYRTNNKSSTCALWNNSVTYSVTLNNVIDGGDEDRAGYDKVAVTGDGNTIPFKFDGNRGILP